MKRGRKAITIVDIAEHLGVSDATVSRALQGKLVSRKTIDCVRAAAQELGYRPNIGARIMKSGRTEAFGILVPTITHPYVARMVELMQAAADKVNYNIMLGVYEEDAEICARFLDQMVGDRRVDGLIFLPMHDDRIHEKLEDLEAFEAMPIVTMAAISTRLHSVFADFPAILRRAVGHLCDLGHRRFGFLVASLGSSTEDFMRRTEGRFSGLEEGLRAHGLTLADVQLEYIHNSYEQGYEGALRLLQRDPRPTAVLAMNDQMAVCVLQAARTLGLQVPRDLSVVGSDNIDLARIFDLTTGDVQLEKQAEAAISILVRSVLGGERFEKPEKIVFSSELIVRGTTGPVPR